MPETLKVVDSQLRAQNCIGFGYGDTVQKFRESAFIKAAYMEKPDRTPVWFMRQAGRSLPEYFEVRGQGSILNAISEPERAAEITLQPTRRYDIDAAILFSDIITPLWAIDFGIDIKPGVGPFTEQPFKTSSDMGRLRNLEPETDMPFQSETIKLLTKELEIPLIGFCGAPFTLATYLIEGKPSKNHENTKKLMFENPKLWHQLCDQLADIVIVSLRSQIEAGASAVQLFDSWAGILNPAHYKEYVYPHSQKILESIKQDDIPRTHFGINTSELLDQFADAGAEVVGVDWKTSIGEARRKTGNRVALQGNLDPTLCLTDFETVKPEVERILQDNGNNPGYIFNLGHGVMPETKPETLKLITDLVHNTDLSATT